MDSFINQIPYNLKTSRKGQLLKDLQLANALINSNYSHHYFDEDVIRKVESSQRGIQFWFIASIFISPILALNGKRIWMFNRIQNKLLRASCILISSVYLFQEFAKISIHKKDTLLTHEVVNRKEDFKKYRAEVELNGIRGADFNFLFNK